MQSFKRNQASEAISVAIGQGTAPSTSLRTEMKRLLDTDRSVDVSARSNDPEHANYAFFSGEAPGRGTEVWFSQYEIFALRLGLDLMEHGWPQATVISVLRRARPDLERMHAQILHWDPAEIFDEKKILEAAKPGTFAVWTTRPVHLVIASRKGRPIEQTLRRNERDRGSRRRRAHAVPPSGSWHLVHNDRTDANGARLERGVSEHKAEQTRKEQFMTLTAGKHHQRRSAPAATRLRRPTSRSTTSNITR